MVAWFGKGKKRNQSSLAGQREKEKNLKIPDCRKGERNQ